MKRNRVNVLTVVNSASNITNETIDGKPHIVVRGITPVVDDIRRRPAPTRSTALPRQYQTFSSTYGTETLCSFRLAIS